jgi:hypothetical protein
MHFHPPLRRWRGARLRGGEGALSLVRDPPWRRRLEGGPELILLERWRRPSRSSAGGAGGAAAFALVVRCPFPPSSGCSCSSSPPADVPWPRAAVDPDLRPLLSCPAAAEQERGAEVAAVHVADSPGGAEATQGGAAMRASGVPEQRDDAEAGSTSSSSPWPTNQRRRHRAPTR